MIFFKKSSLLFVVIALFALLSGCGRGEAVDEADKYISTIEQINIPDDVRVIGLGEATHGNIRTSGVEKRCI